MNPLISIIIRTKNEEKWIGKCLTAVFNQEYKNFEVIVVDNLSQDRTLEIVKKFPCKILGIEKFFPGKSLNIGIKEAKGEYVVCLSGHCIPANEFWLENLLKEFEGGLVGGVYGRQEPLPESNSFDKRDLFITFGLDKKIQTKDSFFHNANSMIPKKLWENLPFDEEVTNIEDRIWAKEILKKGYKIIYTPEASVFHHHGIHQGRDTERAESTVKIIERIDKVDEKDLEDWFLKKKNLKIAAIIPLRKNLEKDDPNLFIEDYLIKKTIEVASNSKFIDKVVVSTSDESLKNIAKKYGAHAPFIRPKELSETGSSLDDVLKHAVEWLEENEGYKTDIVVLLEINHPFRTSNLIDEVIMRLITEKMDSVFVGKKEFKSFWRLEKGAFQRVDEGFLPKEIKKPIYIGLTGLACATLTDFVKNGKRLGENICIVEIKDPYMLVEINENMDPMLAKGIIEEWERRGS